MLRLKPVTLVILIALAPLLSGCGVVSGVTGLGWVTFSDNRVHYNDTAWCVPRKLKKVLNRVAKRYGKVTVTSTKRWWIENWWKGGASDSYHLKCQAVDFVVGGNPSSVISFLKKQRGVGGYKYYRSGHYHIDTGKRRSW